VSQSSKESLAALGADGNVEDNERAGSFGCAHPGSHCERNLDASAEVAGCTGERAHGRLSRRARAARGS